MKCVRLHRNQTVPDNQYKSKLLKMITDCITSPQTIGSQTIQTQAFNPLCD